MRWGMVVASKKLEQRVFVSVRDVVDAVRLLKGLPGSSRMSARGPARRCRGSRRGINTLVW